MVRAEMFKNVALASCLLIIVVLGYWVLSPAAVPAWFAKSAAAATAAIEAVPGHGAVGEPLVSDGIRLTVNSKAATGALRSKSAGIPGQVVFVLYVTLENV